ncbi:MAG: alpha-hydroxy-acid oxidizing enzyme [Acidobacteria bacterium RIFCSPLOWO2_12_FULL_67_14b]|nr:MAG: alpha-hydroxy-acid oxidizing enzyme [Acidobacteria bacterium RIFCSPLOWO2_12_FULL_67_14b]
MPQPVASPHAVTIEDLRLLAKRRLPRMAFDYIDGGAEREWTLRENCRAFEDVLFRPRSAVATPACSLHTTILGSAIDLPFVLAPVGSSRMFYPRGEEVAAGAAGKAGTIYTLSTLSGCTLEDVKAATTGVAWYQLYLVGGRDVAHGAIARAKAAGYKALVVTIDTPVAGMRERDPRNGVKELIARNLSTVPFLGQMLSRPAWLYGFFRDGGLMNFPNIVLKDGPMGYADVGAALEQSMVSWDDFRWIRDAWGGPVVVKGVHTADDARRAVGEGAEAIVVSNHGARQLDGVAATIRVLPEVVAAVKGQTEILLDGGIRRGSDIVKALCMGARAVLVGRAYAYGLGAAGEAGVSRAIEILRADVIRTMKLLGCAAVAGLDGSFVDVPAEWTARLPR